MTTNVSPQIGGTPEDKEQQMSTSEIRKSDQISQFALAQVPFHRHNGSDSPRVSFLDLSNRSEFFQTLVPGTSAATASNYGVFFIAPLKAVITAISEVHQTAGTDAGAVTLQIERLTGTQASGAGTSLLNTGFNLKGTINTVVTATFTSTTISLANINKTNFALAKGDRLGLVLSGTPTAVAQVLVQVQLNY